MKTILIILSLFLSLTSNAQQLRLYKYNNQIIAVPQQQKKQLEGVGVDFIDKLHFDTEKDDKGLELKKAWMWIGGCGKVSIEDSKILEVKEGTMIRARMTGVKKCEIKSWEKF